MMKHFSVACAKAAFALAFVAVSGAFAADGVRYKDRLFKVSEAKSVAVAKDVPFLDSRGMDNYNALTKLMTFAVSRPAYFYVNEIVKKQDLLMDVYEPVDDTAKHRAAVIVCHGGAFIAGSKDDFTQKSVAYTDSLAARGYVTASLEYRQGVKMVETQYDGGYDEAIDSVDFARTVYKAAQDIHAAVRYFRKNADEYGIDTNKIYILGNSAGGMLALENIYAKSKDDMPDYIARGAMLLPKNDDATEFDTIPLGDFDEYGETGVGGRANGAVSLWGSVHNPDIVKNSDVPVFLAHGDSDDVMPFKKGRAMGDVEKMLAREYGDEVAGLFTDNNIKLIVNVPYLYGSYVVDSILTARNVYHELYAPGGMELRHEFYNSTREDKDGNKIVFADSVQNKVFGFLYKLAVDSIPVEKTTYLPKVALVGMSRIMMGENNRSFTVERGENIAYAVFELNGRRVLAGRASKGETVDLGALRKGIYYLRVQGDVPRRIGLY